jgi:hypothetical protein
LPDNQININTNFSGTAYDYSINGDLIVKSGAKDDFYAERFFVNLTGCVLDSSIQIKSEKPSLTLSTNQTFITGSYITGTLSSNSASGVKIFSGSFDSDSTFSFYSIPTQLVKASSSQQVLIQQNYPALGDFISDYTLSTSAGDYDNQLRVTGVDVPFINYIFSVDEGSDTLNSITQETFTSGVSKVGSLVLNYAYETNRSELVPNNLPISISLIYSSGTTGYMGMVSDINIVSGGNGYLSAPIVIFSGGFESNTVRAFTAASNYFVRPDFQAFTFYSGQNIAFYKPSGSILPSPMVENQTYYVRELFPSAPPYFTISNSPGGALFDITNTGSGNFYFYDPTKVASGTALLGVDSLTYDSVVDVNMSYFGSGYSSAPTIIFSGGTGILNNFNPSLASGIATTSFYTKSVTGFFNLSTGIGTNLINYRDNSFTSGSAGYVKTGVSIFDSSSISVQVTYDTKFDQEPLVAKLILSGINNNIIERYITGVK